jgi:4,5-dihydroxyphthalate decarboxylase
MASRNYDGIAPIIRREVTIPGVEIDVTVDNNVPRVFGALYRGLVDVSEMSLAELIHYVSRDQAEFIAIPVFPSRVFRHGHLFCNLQAGIRGPADLNGRKIGFQRWVQTAGVWMRGMLVEDYGVAPGVTEWYVAATHHWDDESGDRILPRDGSVIRRFTASSVHGSDDAFNALLDGEVDVMGVTEVQAPALLADPAVRRLFPDYRAEELAYFQRTRIFPIMHVLAMRTSLVASRPDLPSQLFSAFSEAKRRVQQAARALPSWSLAWKDRYFDDERQAFGGDLWPFGLAANHHVIDKFIGYCYQQGIADRRLTPAELFVPSTRELTEEGDETG